MGFDGIDFTDSNANLIVSFWDAAGNRISRINFNNNIGGSVGDNEYYSFFSNVFGSGVQNVKTVVFRLTGSGAIDNITYLKPEVVPLPGAFMLLLSGLAGLNFSMRRNKKAL